MKEGLGRGKIFPRPRSFIPVLSQVLERSFPVPILSSLFFEMNVHHRRGI